MRKRLTTMTGVMAALAALAVGGSAIATAAQGTAKKPAVEQVTGPDRDAVQSGDQTTPDTTKAIHKSTAVPASEPASSESASESAPENSESSAPSDGPGGHEDPPGVDSQTQE